MSIEIGIDRQARRGYGLDEVTIVPSTRTLDPESVDISWGIGGRGLGLPLLASAMDAVTSPATAVEIGRLGGLAVLNLEGLQTRYVDPEPIFEEIAGLPEDKATRRMQELYAEPIKEHVIARRIREIKDGGVVAAASLTPGSVTRFSGPAKEAGLDVLVVQGTVVSVDHVSSGGAPVDLEAFISGFGLPVIVGGCASFPAALRLMQTGAAGILVGVGPGAACTSRAVLGVGVPQATAIADAAAARRRHLQETGRYVQVIADGGMRTGGDVAKAFACGADAVMIGSPLARAYEAPGRGHHWGMATFHPTLPRGTRVRTRQVGSIEEILVGPAHENDGTLNLFGALRTSMATCGYGSIQDFQEAEVMVAPAVATEGKALQRSQGVGAM